MTKSKIIADLTCGDTNEEKAIERLLIIGLELDNKQIEEWAECELKGYDADRSIPDYRRFGFGAIKYSGLIHNLKIQNAAMQLEAFDEKTLEAIRESCVIRNGIASIKNAIESGSTSLQMNLSYLIGHVYSRTNIQCSSLYMEIPISAYQGVISGVRVSLIKALRALENSFGSLDSFDLNYDAVSSEKIAKVEQAVTSILYADNKSITTA